MTDAISPLIIALDDLRTTHRNHTRSMMMSCVNSARDTSALHKMAEDAGISIPASEALEKFASILEAHINKLYDTPPGQGGTNADNQK